MADLPPDSLPEADGDAPEARPTYPGAPIAWLTVGVGVVMAVLLALFAWFS